MGSATVRCPLAGQATYRGPSYWYDHSYGQSITGGFRYRGSTYRPALYGAYIGGDFISGRVFMMNAGTRRTVGTLPRVTSFGESQGRELWAVTIDGGLFSMRARVT